MEETTLKNERRITMKKRTIINANDLNKALRGEEVQSYKKKTATAAKAASAICQQLVFMFEVKPEENYFAGIEDIETLKAKYKELALIHHPDRGGDSSTMAEINAEFDQKAKELGGTGIHKKNEREDKAAGMTEEELEAAIAAEFKATLEALVKLDLDGVVIELIGSWLWVSGDTKKIKEELKEINFHWNFSRKLWQWHDSYINYRFRKGRNKADKEDIEDKYGKQVLKSA